MKHLIRKQGCDMPMIVPRFVLEMHPQQLLDVLTDMKPEAIRLLAKECRKQMFDGLVRSCLRLEQAQNLR